MGLCGFHKRRGIPMVVMYEEMGVRGVPGGGVWATVVEARGGRHADLGAAPEGLGFIFC
ncbi:hypothetical protein V6Z12_A10G252100 [Gossypium hirsutum]